MTAFSQDVAAHHTTEANVRDWYGEPDRPPRRPLLDNPSEPNPILTLLMDDALSRLILTADGPAMALKVRVTGSHEHSAPTSDLAEIVETLAQRFSHCRTHRARLIVIREAQTLLDRLRYAPNRSLVRGTPEWKESIAKDPRSCRVLASIWDVHYATISRIKKRGVA